MNAALQHSGEPSHPIMPKDEWLAEIYRPRIEYAKYYVRYTKSKSPTTPLIPYEAWKKTEYKKLIPNEKEASKAADSGLLTTPPLSCPSRTGFRRAPKHRVAFPCLGHASASCPWIDNKDEPTHQVQAIT